MSGSFLDARKLPNNATWDADVCIVGSGPAGITISRELARAGVRVILLEAGGLQVDREVDALSRTENAGRDYNADVSRMRCFGGASALWGGHCVPLTPLDFERRDWIADSGWPYGFEELRPYYARARKLLEIEGPDHDAASAAREMGASVLPFDSRVVETTVSRYNAMRFGPKFGPELNALPSLTCILYADVSAIDLAGAESERVSQVRVRSIAGNQFSVSARFYVIACGAVENARILLASNHQRTAGLGNHADMVGRCFMEHIWLDGGYLVTPSSLGAYKIYTRETPFPDRIKRRFHIALPDEELQRQRIPAFRAELKPSSSFYWEASKGRANGLHIAEISALLSRPFAVGNAIRCRSAATPDALLLNNNVEQTPNRESRVTLSERRDPLGRPQPRLAWRLSAIDHEGIIKAHRVLAREAGRADVGRVRLAGRRAEEIMAQGVGANHHMGTTRMHDDPRQGVTDGHGRVHYTHNLFVAGSSLFPTCGYANPTLTIIATSIRMADALKQRLAG